MPDLWTALGTVDDFAEGSSIFSNDDADRAYFVNGTQVASMHTEGRLELRLTRKVISAHRPRLKAEPSVALRSSSDWITVDLDADPALVLELAELAAAAHRPPPGVTTKPPPTGADLERRRRFH